MTTKRINKRNVVIPNNLSEDEVDSFKSKDDISRVTFTLQNELNMSEKSSISKTEQIKGSENEEKEIEGKVENNQKLKRKKNLVG